MLRRARMVHQVGLVDLEGEIVVILLSIRTGSLVRDLVAALEGSEERMARHREVAMPGIDLTAVLLMGHFQEVADKVTEIRTSLLSSAALVVAGGAPIVLALELEEAEEAGRF